MAYVFRKLAHTFYDDPEDRKDYIVDESFRSRRAIIEAAKRIFDDLGLGTAPLQTLEHCAMTDDGFPDDFCQEIENDIRKRNLEQLSFCA